MRDLLAAAAAAAAMMVGAFMATMTIAGSSSIGPRRASQTTPQLGSPRLPLPGPGGSRRASSAAPPRQVTALGDVVRTLHLAASWNGPAVDGDGS